MKEELIIKVVSKAMDFLTHDQAQALRSILEEELYNFELQPISTALVPTNGIKEKVLLYLASKKLDGLSPLTLDGYKRHLYNFSQVVQKDVENITAMDIRMYLALFTKSGVKNSTIATEISILRSFFNWLDNEDYIVKSPMRKIKTIKCEKRVRKALTPEELEMLRDACKTPREHALVEFFYSTGCRLDEVYKLNKSGIDWNTSKVMVIGKGNKERPVFLNAKSKIYLWKYFNSRDDGNDILFVSERKPHGRLSGRAIEQTFSNLGKRAGITKNVFPHLLRHTTATSMLNNGASLAEVQNLLGHETPATTTIYARLNTEELQMSHKKHLA